MNLANLEKVHIIGIGGCAASAIAELLVSNNVTVTGSEMKKNDGLAYLIDKGIIISEGHSRENLYIGDKTPDVILYSPAVIALDPGNPELAEGRKQGIPLMSWQTFIGDYLNSIGKMGITVSGSEGKGTTAGILTMIIKDTKWEPLAILGAKVKNIIGSQASNIYIGNGLTYILEGDEYNRNFHHYHPEINVMINFQYEHPETYENFDAYKKSFYEYFCGMQGEKVLILHAVENTVEFVKEYKLSETHTIIWFCDEKSRYADIADYLITNHRISPDGNYFTLKVNDSTYDFYLPALPGYMVNNATGAIIAALKLGVDGEVIKTNIKRFTGMVRRFDVYRTGDKGVVVTDYGHSPKAIGHIVKEIKALFPEKSLHLIFQPHLFSRTFNFFNEFVTELQQAEKVSIIDIYPARENPAEWQKKISSQMLVDALKKEKGDMVYYGGKSKDIRQNLRHTINSEEITCFIGAGDMDVYYPEILADLKVEPYFKR